MAAHLKVPVAEAESRLAALIEERKTLERQLAEAKRQLAMGGGSEGGSTVQDVNGVKFMGKVMQGLAAKELRGLVDQGKSELGSGVVAFVAVSEDGKVGISVGVSADLTDRLNAVDLVRAGAEALGGSGGGGRPDMAQAGGPDADKADAAIEAVKVAMATLISKA
jgi:alanyl-tRNA synthetase